MNNIQYKFLEHEDTKIAYKFLEYSDEIMVAKQTKQA